MDAINASQVYRALSTEDSDDNADDMIGIFQLTIDARHLMRLKAIYLCLGVWEGDGGRCQRCAKYFSSRQLVDNTSCIFHKGLYIDPGVARYQFSSSIWSCCKSADQNSIGCTHASSHVECQVTRKALSRMQNGEEKVGGRMAVELVDVQQEGEDREEERIAEGGQEGMLSHLRAVEKAFACSGKAAEHGDFLVHAYSHGETMPGLALRYGITVAEIQKANNFSHSSLDPGRKVLLIPRKPEKAGTTVYVSLIPLHLCLPSCPLTCCLMQRRRRRRRTRGGRDAAA